MDIKRYALALAAYLVPTFGLAIVWHLIVFASYYDALEVYREDMIIPFGFATMLLQGGIYGWLYPRIWGGLSIASGGLRAGLIFGILSWSYMVLAVGAKHRMASVPDYMVIETCFVALQFAIYGPLIAWVWRDIERR